MALTNDASNLEEKSQDFSSLDKLFKGIAGFPGMLKILEAQGFEIKEIRRQLAELLRYSHSDRERGWLDAKAAATYLGVSSGTFDKYRYLTNPRLKGYRLGGKTLYQRDDLDTFVKLFEARSSGLA